MQRKSYAELRERRAEAVAAIGEVAELEFVNAGGTGDLQLVASEPAMTEATAGSGFYAPTLFDNYSAFTLQPAALRLAGVIAPLQQPARLCFCLECRVDLYTSPLNPDRTKLRAANTQLLGQLSRPLAHFPQTIESDWIKSLKDTLCKILVFQMHPPLGCSARRKWGSGNRLEDLICVR
jgi:hypothetical protein